MKYLKVIALTHKHIDLKELGKFVICNETLEERLKIVKAKFNIGEIFYIGTCNRVEFVFTSEQKLDSLFVEDFIRSLNFCIPDSDVAVFAKQASLYENIDALNHLLRISCSLESLVVGEKEILSQIRKAYETCKAAGLTSDYLRLVMSRVVKTAKEVYTHTKISKNPISVVSLAYRKLRDLNMCANAKILIIGAGETNNNISKYLKKHKFSNFVVFNRTVSKASLLAAELGGEAFPLEELANFSGGFDVIVTCTSAVEPIITPAVYETLLNGDTSKKVIVDLAIPNDTSKEVIDNYPLHYIDVCSLQEIANKNLKERYEELVHAEQIINTNIDEFLPILKERRVELAMREVPEKIKQIKSRALNSVFADDVKKLDDDSREVLEKIIDYMEKKYISVPMIMAKEILVKNS